MKIVLCAFISTIKFDFDIGLQWSLLRFATSLWHVVLTLHQLKSNQLWKWNFQFHMFVVYLHAGLIQCTLFWAHGALIQSANRRNSFVGFKLQCDVKLEAIVPRFLTVVKQLRWKGIYFILFLNFSQNQTGVFSPSFYLINIVYVFAVFVHAISSVKTLMPNKMFNYACKTEITTYNKMNRRNQSITSRERIFSKVFSFYIIITQAIEYSQLTTCLLSALMIHLPTRVRITPVELFTRIYMQSFFHRWIYVIVEI